LTQSQQLADEMRRAFSGEAWHGPALTELLDRVDPASAAARPVAGAHSIAELVAHLAFWHDVVRRRTEGEVVSPRDGADFPPVEASASGWAALREQLVRSHRALVSRVESLDAERLSAMVPGRTISVAAMLHGVVQHDAYHGGQIALLLRAQGVT
jgi:uncharacterized damage-inducible protein DinB